MEEPAPLAPVCEDSSRQAYERRRSPLPFGLSWEKLIIWAMFAGLAYALREFFTIVFLTFIFSYIAHNVVSFLTGAAGRQKDEEHWAHVPIVLIVYLAAISVGYLATQSVVPLAVDQGKWLLGHIQTLDLEKLREEVLAQTVGRIEFARFKHGEGYQEAYDTFRREGTMGLGFAESRKIARQIRDQFRETQVRELGLAALEELKRSQGFMAAYEKWVREKRADEELRQNPSLHEKLTTEYDDSWRRVYGQDTFETESKKPEYLRQRHERVVEMVTKSVVAEKRDLLTAEQDIGHELGEEAFSRLDPRALEARFRTYFDSEVKTVWRDFPYEYSEFRALETAKDEAELLQTLGREPLDDEAAEAKFQDYMRMKLARENSLSELLGKSSQMWRSVVPTLTDVFRDGANLVTTWLTNAVNNVLSFSFSALVSLGFSLMIVWEIPRLRRGLMMVRGTRAERIFNEFAPGIHRLGIVIGTAMSAQMIISSINAVFAFVILNILDVPSSLFLSLVVMVLGLIPYVGTIMASVPVVLIALQAGGVELGFKAAMAMFCIHELEAWVLSPRILGDFFELSPVVIIAVLFVGEQLFGIWGLVLAVPVSVFIMKDVLLKPLVPPPQHALPSPD